jgi:hypothetical protein
MDDERTPLGAMNLNDLSKTISIAFTRRMRGSQMPFAEAGEFARAFFWLAATNG